jgi:hypothetical protein
MSQTIAHRHHAHVYIPLTPIIALLVAVIVAAAILVAVNQPTSTNTRTETSVTAATVAVPVSVPKPESPAMRRQVMAQAHAAPMTPAEWRIMHNHPEGTTLDASGGYAAPPASGVYVTHRAGKFPGKAR